MSTGIQCNCISSERLLKSFPRRRYTEMVGSVTNTAVHLTSSRLAGDFLLNDKIKCILIQEVSNSSYLIILNMIRFLV